MQVSILSDMTIIMNTIQRISKVELSLNTHMSRTAAIGALMFSLKQVIMKIHRLTQEYRPLLKLKKSTSTWRDAITSQRSSIYARVLNI